MSNLISRKGVILIIIPLFAVFLQFFIRTILCLDFNTIGITLGALGLGQMLPFLYFDHFIANKVLGLDPNYELKPAEFTVKYKLSSNIESNDIDKFKNLFMAAIFFNLALFLVTVYFGIKGEIILHIIFGSFSCLISWYLLVFK